MNTIRFYLILTFSALGLGTLNAQYSEQFFMQKVAEVQQAQAACDFRAIALAMHEHALAYYRKILSAEIAELTDQYGADRLQGAIDMTDDRLRALSDVDFFVSLCGSLIKTKADLVKPIIIVGVVQEAPECYHVIYRAGGLSAADSDSEILFRSTQLMTFRRTALDVKLWDIVLVRPSVSELRRRMAKSSELAAER